MKSFIFSHREAVRSPPPPFFLYTHISNSAKCLSESHMVQIDSDASHCEMHKPPAFIVSASANGLRAEKNIRSLILILDAPLLDPVQK